MNFKKIAILSILTSFIFSLSFLFSEETEKKERILAEETVAISAKVLSKEESKLYFKRDLLTRGIIPIQIIIDNPTPKTFTLPASAVNLPMVTANRVAFSVTKSSIPRSIAYKVAGFFFWPVMIPGTIDSIKTVKTHVQLRKKITARSMKEERIPAYASLNRILFIKEKDLRDFKISLLELKTQELITLDVPLPKSAKDST